ncbi:MAG: Rho termination factor N-terminal domain-containing protein, partial [Actinomycetota bacterium]|nr:Rho termination factor N-terminal domain-containing protein [Actinomycetota bacterium]
MTDTTDLTAEHDASSDGRAARTRGGLAAMNVVDLKNLAGQLGIRGTARMRKDDLVASIVDHQAGSAAPVRARSGTSSPAPAASLASPVAETPQAPPTQEAPPQDTVTSRGTG